MINVCIVVNIDSVNEINKEFFNNLLKISDVKKVSIKETQKKDVLFFDNTKLIDNFLFNLSQKNKWVIYFDDCKEKKETFNIIYMPINFYGDIEQFKNKSFTENAKNKLIYNDLSKYYMASIANDTLQESNFLIKVFKEFSPNKTMKILDCCCGVGRHDFELAKKGYKITGIDISKNQIATANKIHSHENIEYLVHDIRDYQLNVKNYDMAICMWTTYNYLSLNNDFLIFIKNAYNHLGENGILLLDSKNIPSLDLNRTYSRNNKVNDISIQLLINKRIFNNIQNSQYFYFIENKEKNEFYFDEEFVRFYTIDEIQNISKPYFEIIKCYGDFNSDEYQKDSSTRFILILKKRGE